MSNNRETACLLHTDGATMRAGVREMRKGTDTKEIIRRAMSELGRRSAAKLTPQQLKERGRKGALSTWANLTPEERSVEMKRRAVVRKRNRTRKKK